MCFTIRSDDDLTCSDEGRIGDAAESIKKKAATAHLAMNARETRSLCGRFSERYGRGGRSRSGARRFCRYKLRVLPDDCSESHPPDRPLEQHQAFQANGTGRCPCIAQGGSKQQADSGPEAYRSPIPVIRCRSPEKSVHTEAMWRVD